MKLDDFNEFDDFDDDDLENLTDSIDFSWYNVSVNDNYCPIGADRLFCSGCSFVDDCKWCSTD